MPTRAVLLDSGGVLIRPVRGDWFPGPAFHETLERHAVEWDTSKLVPGLEAAMRHLDEVHHVPLRDEDEEAKVMVRFYEILLTAIGVEASLSEEVVGSGRDRSHVEPFDWTVPVLTEIRRRGLRVVIVSDSWPSLRRYYRRRGLDALVDGMVISAEQGMTKPSPAMYERGLELAGCDAADAVFVDDWPDAVIGARDLGIRGYRLRPDGAEPSPDVDEILDLRELLDLL